LPRREAEEVMVAAGVVAQPVEAAAGQEAEEVVILPEAAADQEEVHLSTRVEALAVAAAVLTQEEETPVPVQEEGIPAPTQEEEILARVQGVTQAAVSLVLAQEETQAVTTVLVRAATLAMVLVLEATLAMVLVRVATMVLVLEATLAMVLVRVAMMVPVLEATLAMVLVLEEAGMATDLAQLEAAMEAAHLLAENQVTGSLGTVAQVSTGLPGIVLTGAVAAQSDMIHAPIGITMVADHGVQMTVHGTTGTAETTAGEAAAPLTTTGPLQDGLHQLNGSHIKYTRHMYLFSRSPPSTFQSFPSLLSKALSSQFLAQAVLRFPRLSTLFP